MDKYGWQSFFNAANTCSVCFFDTGPEVVAWLDYCTAQALERSDGVLLEPHPELEEEYKVDVALGLHPMAAAIVSHWPHSGMQGSDYCGTHPESFEYPAFDNLDITQYAYNILSTLGNAAACSY